MSTQTLASIPDLDRLIRPRAIAIVGASGDLSRIGGQPLRALTQFGYAGPVYPVNPKYKRLADLKCYGDVRSVPQPCDLAIVAVPSARVASVIEECGAAGIRFAVILSSGFREIGPAGAQMQDELLAAGRRSGVRMIGPNCQGIMNLATRMFAGFGTAFRNPNLRAGPLAMVTQSGSFGFSVVTEVVAAGLGFNYSMSTGNEADISALDLLEFFLEQEDVEVLTTYIEGIKDGRRLVALGERALELGKPILIWKVGNSRSGQRAAVSHTANLTSGPELYQAAFRQGGFVEVQESWELIDVARAFLAKRMPRGRNVAIFTSSGGFGVLAADRCEARGLAVPELSEDTRVKLRGIVPEYASLGNPIDVTAQLSTDALAVNRALGVLVDDPGIDQIMVRKGSTDGEAGGVWASNLVELIAKVEKPMLVSVMEEGSGPAVQIFNEHRVAWSPTASGLVSAALALCEFSEKRERWKRRVGRVVQRREIHWPVGRVTLDERLSKQVLTTYGILGVREMLLEERDLFGMKDCTLKFPLAVKVASADIAHKTEAGAVKLGIRTMEELKAAAAQVLTSARAHHPQALLNGVLVQEMAEGVEMILGMVNDDFFGPVVALGMGGIFAETLRDVTHRCAPVDVSTARVMIGELKGAALLNGLRGSRPVNMEALAQAVSLFSCLAADHSDRVLEIDINPLFVHERGVTAADALIVLRD